VVKEALAGGGQGRPGGRDSVAWTGLGRISGRIRKKCWDPLLLNHHVTVSVNKITRLHSPYLLPQHHGNDKSTRCAATVPLEAAALIKGGSRRHVLVPCFAVNLGTT
jgi:hypothetical protein